MLDVSSYQGMDIGPLIDQLKPEAVIVRAYQDKVEHAGYTAFSFAQAKTATERGLPVPFYGWCYQGIDGAQQAKNVLDTVRQSPVGWVPFVAVDIETYSGAYPSIDTALAMLEEIERQGYVPVVYTGRFMWDSFYKSDTRLSRFWLWAADYNGDRDLDSVKLFGGWTRDKLVGHQHTSTPVDQSVFRADILGV